MSSVASPPASDVPRDGMSGDCGGVLRDAGESASRRLALRAWCQLLQKSLWWLVGLVLVPLLLARFFGLLPWAGWGAGVVVVGLWFVICGGLAWSKRPDRFGALAAWDRAAGRKDELASGYAFEELPESDLRAGHRLHLKRAASVLQKDKGGVVSAFPLKLSPFVWALPVLMLVLLVLPHTRPAAAVGDAELGAAGLAAAEDEAAELDAAADGLDELASMEALEEEERERLEELRDSMESASKELADASGKTARDVLAALEERAQEAEDLADELGGDGPWASDEMIAEMGRHADTADLADAVGDQGAAEAAAEAKELADKLADEGVGEDAAARMGRAFSRVMDAAIEEDSEKLVGQHMNGADQSMQSEDRKGAAAEMAQMAQALQREAQRQAAQEELEELAEQLREAGAQIAGGDSGAMEEVDGNSGVAQSGGAGGELPPPPEGMEPMDPSGGGAQGGQLPPPGMGQPPSTPQVGQTGQGQQGDGGGEPGEGQSQGQGEMGQGQSMPVLMAPVPGQDQPGGRGEDSEGEGMQAFVPGGGEGDPDAFLVVPGSGPRPGHSTANPEGENATAQTDAAHESTVTTQQNADGTSTSRAIMGGMREEEASLSAQRAAVEFLRVEEEALDEASLPVSRRDHILRYFGELRERFGE